MEPFLWLLIIASFLAKQCFNICMCCEHQIMIMMMMINDNNNNNNNNNNALFFKFCEVV